MQVVRAQTDKKRHRGKTDKDRQTYRDRHTNREKGIDRNRDDMWTDRQTDGRTQRKETKDEH